jgi:hypothetical protein
MADPFIVDCKSEYDKETDIIHAIGICATPEGQSLHRYIRSAHFELLLEKNVQNSIEVPPEAYVIKVERHESGEGFNILDDELGEFRAFFSHYPRSRNLNLRWTVELKDGRKGSALRPVQYGDDAVAYGNPFLASRSEPLWKKEVIRDYKRPR